MHDICMVLACFGREARRKNFCCSCTKTCIVYASGVDVVHNMSNTTRNLSMHIADKSLANSVSE